MSTVLYVLIFKKLYIIISTILYITYIIIFTKLFIIVSKILYIISISIQSI